MNSMLTYTYIPTYIHIPNNQQGTAPAIQSMAGELMLVLQPMNRNPIMRIGKYHQDMIVSIPFK